MATMRYIKVWVVRIIVDSDVPTLLGFEPSHEDTIWGIYRSEEEARRKVESHASQNLKHGAPPRHAKNLWVSMDRRSNGMINSVSWHTTTLMRGGNREYTHTTYRYKIEEHLLLPGYWEES